MHLIGAINTVHWSKSGGMDNFEIISQRNILKR